MDQTVDRLRASLVVMEDFHQGVYLGFGKLNKPDDDVYSVWTQHSVNYTVGAFKYALPEGVSAYCTFRCWKSFASPFGTQSRTEGAPLGFFVVSTSSILMRSPKGRAHMASPGIQRRVCC